LLVHISNEVTTEPEAFGIFKAAEEEDVVMYWNANEHDSHTSPRLLLQHVATVVL